MNDTKEFYKEIVLKSMVGYAYHKIILNGSGEPCDYEFIEINSAFEDITGFSKEKTIGKNVKALIPGIENEEFDWIKIYGDIAINGGKTNFEKYSYSLNKYYSVVVYSPKKYYFVTIIKELFDLERKYYESQNTLKYIMEDLKLLLDSTGEAIYSVDAEGKCTFCNKRCLNILGYEKQHEIIGKSMHELIHYKDIEDRPLSEEVCVICNKAKVGAGMHVEGEVFWKKDGGYIYVNCMSYPQMRKNKIVGGVVTFIDVTEIKEVEDKLKESERYKAMLLSNLQGMAYTCDYDEKWTMRFVSDGCFELTGYRPESLIRNKDLCFNDIIDKRYKNKLQAQWEDSLIKRKMFRAEYEIITAFGDKKWVLEQGQGVYGKAGKIETLEGLIIDITESKRKEKRDEQ